MGSPKSMRSAPAVGAVAAVAAQDASCGNLQSPRVVTTLRSDSHASTGFCSRSPPKVLSIMTQFIHHGDTESRREPKIRLNTEDPKGTERKCGFSRSHINALNSQCNASFSQEKPQ